MGARFLTTYRMKSSAPQTITAYAGGNHRFETFEPTISNGLVTAQCNGAVREFSWIPDSARPGCCRNRSPGDGCGL